MKILVIGDRHVSGYGLTAGRLSFLEHFRRQISRSGQSVQLEAYVHATLSAGRLTLSQLPLDQYDLIVVQTGQGCVDHPAGFGALFVRSSGEQADLTGLLSLPTSLQAVAGPKRAIRQGKTWARLFLLKSLAAINQLPRLRTVRNELADLLTTLRPHRHKVLLMSPFTQQEPVRQWLRQQGRALLIEEGERQAFSVFDTDTVIQPREEYFLADSEDDLNAIGHELVGRALFDFYQAAPTIVAIRSGGRS
ncbi:SGNH/GDSL hydrolase family protein [Spirosoma taeanense]|uniref:SGNH/GDSL hydrolase family protein n=1 Tax=Spirosoma taeanense TaxID=2735870 RepID=A0A6M5Y7L3_9BACT|nr:SGNH/GDSL hydrolase family protein [Spirosoma taeanense]QJW89885.1 SGNH/GDSL hydrolase family protein [Spirosoma taeanense]